MAAMTAKTPADICRLFQRAVAAGDLEAVLAVYDPESVFLNRDGERRTGTDGLRSELAPLVAAKAVFRFQVEQVVEAGEVALMHTRWTVTTDREMTLHAIEVARRQRDGSWRWLIGDPFTVGRVGPARAPVRT